MAAHPAALGETVTDESIAQLCYTSGTTGSPKGAVMTHRALMSEYVSCIVECEHTAADRVLAALPLYHTAQLHCFTMPQLMAGAEIVLIEAPAPAQCLELIEQHRVTSFFAPPTVWINPAAPSRFRPAGPILPAAHLLWRRDHAGPGAARIAPAHPRRACVQLLRPERNVAACHPC